MFFSNLDNGLNPLSLLLPPHSGTENASNNHYSMPQTHHSIDPFIPRFNFPVFNPQITTPEPVIHYTELSRNENVLDGCPRLLPVPAKKPVKKDRHSKINTAQGLRDRRVRLSIGIAREFFDLQEMLGFDKPSKTLEWLLKKSRKSIQDLAKTSKIEDLTLNSSTLLFREAVSEIHKSENGVSSCKEKKRSTRFESNDESRAKERERTRDKMSHPDQASDHFGWSNIMQCEDVEKSSSNLYGQIMMTSFYEQTIFEESYKMKFNSSILGYDQPKLCDGISSKDSSSSNNSRNNNRVLEIPKNSDMNNNNNQFGVSAFFCSEGSKSFYGISGQR